MSAEADLVLGSGSFQFRDDKGGATGQQLATAPTARESGDKPWSFSILRFNSKASKLRFF